MELPPAGRRGSFLLVAPLLLISILLEQYWIVRLLPWLSDLGGVQPMIIFLDIPLRLPVIDWIPVGILFVFFYLVVITPELSRHRPSHQGSSYQGPSPAKLLRQKGWAVLTGWWLMLLCLAAGGGLYYLLEDQLPKQVRNGIDSFGIRADISIPYPGEGIVHLHGGMIMLIALLIGGRLFLRRAQLPMPAQPDASPAAPAADTFEKAAVLKAQIPPPRHIPSPKHIPSPGPRVTSPMAPVTQLLPEPSPAIVRPCVVKGVLEPHSEAVPSWNGNAHTLKVINPV
jgi:hypothetical protein